MTNSTVHWVIKRHRAVDVQLCRRKTLKAIKEAQDMKYDVITN